MLGQFVECVSPDLVLETTGIDLETEVIEGVVGSNQEMDASDTRIAFLMGAECDDRSPGVSFRSHI